MDISEKIRVGIPDTVLLDIELTSSDSDYLMFDVTNDNYGVPINLTREQAAHIVNILIDFIES